MYLCVHTSPLVCRRVVDVATGVGLEVMSTNKKTNVVVSFLGMWAPCLWQHLVHPSQHKYIWLHVFRLCHEALYVCLLRNGLAIITPFIHYDGSGTWRMYTRTLCSKWNRQDMKGMAVIEKRAYLVSTKGKGGGRARQMYLVSWQTLGRRWWSARGSWQVLNLSLLSFRRRGCDTRNAIGWKQLVRDKWATIRTQQMEAQT